MSETVTLGPFTGGLNTASGSAIAADNELVGCVNLELDLDGSLQSRPPIVETTTASGTGTMTIIGSAVLAGGTYIFGSNDSGTYYKTDAGAWTLLVADLKARVALQYNDNVYIPAMTGSTVNGGRWDGTTWTTDASMPKGEAAVFYKSRLFVVPGINASTNSSRITYSDVIVAAALTWGASNYIDVSPGDGEKLIDIVVYNDNLLLFKEDSSYVLAYDTQISSAVLRELNSDIGVSGYRCMVTYETSIFILHENKVYEIVSYNFDRINLKVPFEFDGTGTRVHPFFLSLLGDRLIVRFYNKVYVYGLLTKTWCEWDSVSTALKNFGPLIELPTEPSVHPNGKFYAGSSLANTLKVFNLYDGFSSSIVEQDSVGPKNIVCFAVTKTYHFNYPQNYKKLMWWGADVISYSTVTANAHVSGAAAVESVAASGSLGRKFLKFHKTLRFRQIHFDLELITDGSNVNGPARLYTLSAILSGKQLVEAQVN